MDEKKAGRITKDPDGYHIQFERHYHTDVMTVWDAITNPVKLSVWFMKTDMELHPGARMTFHYADKDDSTGTGTITAMETGKLFEYRWENEEGPYELVRWELFSEGPSSCKLVLTHTRIEEEYRHRVPAGWHIMLGHLQEVLDGRQLPFPPGSDHPGDQAIKDYYIDTVTKDFK